MKDHPFRLVMTLLVRDEEDILEANIRFHKAQGVDLFLIMDHLSTDKTPDIIDRLTAEGVAVGYTQTSDAYEQSSWVTQMARAAYTDFGASWIINSDADEFWWPRAGTLKSVFQGIPASSNTVRALRTNFVPIIADNDQAPFYSNMVYRTVRSLNSLGNPLPPKVAHRGSQSVIVNFGNHSVSDIGPGATEHDLIDIFHYPVRGYSQLLNKISKGGVALSKNTRLPKGVGRTWRQLLEELHRNGDLIDHFNNLAYSGNDVLEGLAAGEIVEDLRLRQFFEAI